MMQSDQTIKESVNSNDLRNLIDPLVSIDQYKSKMGEDNNIIVLALKVKDKNPAMDLSQFIETGFDDVIDVDISSGPDTSGKYSVFVEMIRDDKAYKTINGILNDLKNLDESKDSWKFVSYENKSKQDFNESNFVNSVITSKHDYEIKHNPEAAEISERIKFLNSY